MTPNTNTTFERAMFDIFDDLDIGWPERGPALGRVFAAHNADKAKSLEEFEEAVRTKLKFKLCLKDAVIISSALDQALSLMENK